MGLQFRRGTAAEVTSENFIPAIGEPVYITDEDKLYVGDGATLGGNLVGGAEDLGDLSNVHLTTQDIGTIQSYSITSNTVTINTSEGNPYVVNQRINISNAGVTILNGTHTVISKPAANQFLFELTASDIANTLTTGTTTPVIDDGELVAFDSANSRFTNKKQNQALGRLSNHSDVDAYDIATASPNNNSTGKILRYDLDNNWSIKRTGEAIRITSGQHFIGVDFSAGTTGNVYTGNAAEWTEDLTGSIGNNSTDLHSANPGSIPAPPYGDAAYDSNSHDYSPVGSYEDSTDFTLDWWLYKVGGAGAWNEGLFFYSNLTPSYKFFYPEYSNTSLRLYSGATGTGTVTSFAQDVISWDVPALVDQWVHVCIVRKGVDFRAWVNGTDEGPGTIQSGFAVDHNFKFSSAGSFYSIQYENDGHLIGPHYVDLKKAHRDPFGGDIEVPIERVDFNNYKSGINVDELDNVTNNAFVDGDVLAYKNGIWTRGNIGVAPDGTGELTVKGNTTGGSGKVKLNCETNAHGVTIQGPPHSAAANYSLVLPNDMGTSGYVLTTDGSSNTSWSAPSAGALDDLSNVSVPTPADGEVLIYSTANSRWEAGQAASQALHTSFEFSAGGTVPSATISNSSLLGQNWGTWTETNSTNQFGGPSSSTYDPTLTGITFSSSTGEFTGFPAGRYQITCGFTVAIDNVTPGFGSSLSYLISADNIAGTFGYTSELFRLTVLPYTSYGSTASEFQVKMDCIAVFEETTASNNRVEIYLDQDIKPSHYIPFGNMNIIKFADL